MSARLAVWRRPGDALAASVAASTDIRARSTRRSAKGDEGRRRTTPPIRRRRRRARRQLRVTGSRCRASAMEPSGSGSRGGLRRSETSAPGRQQRAQTAARPSSSLAAQRHVGDRHDLAGLRGRRPRCAAARRAIRPGCSSVAHSARRRCERGSARPRSPPAGAAARPPAGSPVLHEIQAARREQARAPVRRARA